MTRFDRVRSINSVLKVEVRGKSFRQYYPHFEYYKRDGSTFYFRCKKSEFSVNLSGGELYFFLENYEIGDLIIP